MTILPFGHKLHESKRAANMMTRDRTIAATVTGVTLHEGAAYRNARGDVRGPMTERVPGVWLDQYGTLFHQNGIEWGHVIGSTANIVSNETES